MSTLSPLARHIQTAAGRFRRFGVFDSVALQHAGTLLNKALSEGPEFVDGLNNRQAMLLHNYSSMIGLQGEVFSVMDYIDRFSFGPGSQLRPNPAEQRFFRGEHFATASDAPQSSIIDSLADLIAGRQFQIKTNGARVLNICGGNGSILESISKYYSDSDLVLTDPNWVNMSDAVDRFSNYAGANRVHMRLGDPRLKFNGIPYGAVFDMILLGKGFDRSFNFDDTVLLFQSVVMAAKYGSAMMLVEINNPYRLIEALNQTSRKFIFPTDVHQVGDNMYLATSESTALFERVLCCKTGFERE